MLCPNIYVDFVKKLFLEQKGAKLGTQNKPRSLSSKFY
jgi:hypothetical protein